MWIFVLVLAAVALGGFTARTAMERGRSGAAWAAWSVSAGVVTEIVAVLLFGRSVGGDVTSLEIGGILVSVLLSLLGPLAAMLLVLALLMRLPERVPDIGGARWPMYRMSTKEERGADCELSVETSGVRVGDQLIATAALTEIGTDGECLRLACAGQTILLLPAGKGRSERMRMKQSQAIERRLTRLLGRA